MKKALFILLSLLCILTIYLLVSELSYSPLKEKEFEILFPDYKGDAKKFCDIDYLGINFKGEVFEIYLYKIGIVSIAPNYPAFKEEWENREITKETNTSSWIRCPIDSVTKERYRFALTANNFNEKKCISSFNNELINHRNYYSYVYFNELECYFLLYCPDKGNLYYIRLRGF